ncbi:diguanylate cyclase domain-containing protein, partial [Thermus sp.]|uniref:diguanylate cyclase domain-containing protein n=1 Tax=Thermus sp. TaxID=275 RepID=UPI00298F10B2
MTSGLLPPQVLQAVLEQLAESVLITDASGRILYVNEAFERLTGYRREEVLGKNPRFLKSGRHPLEFYQAFWQGILSGKPFRGVFVNRRKDGSLYTEEKVVTPVQGPTGKVEYLVATSRDITEEMALKSRLEELSTLDPLTGLLNRRAFSEQVETDLLRSGSRRALAYLDLDRFKAVNDTLGHAAGDRVLARLGSRLREALPHGVVGRLGGDEFAAWFPAKDALEAREKAQHLLRAVGMEVVVEGQPVRLEASLGLALYPEHGVTLAELLRRADLAMYRAKAFRLPHPEVFTPDLDGLTPQTLALEAEFHRALASGKATLWFQSLLDLRHQTYRDAEVLFRMESPRGLLNPLGQLDLSRRAVNEALDRFVFSQIALLQKRFPSLRLWANVTPWSLSDLGFLALVEQEVHRGLHPERVVLEVSERLALPHLSRITPALWRLKTLGFRLALDDFGTGQTSLLHLKSLPLDFLKISRELLWLGRGEGG